MKNVKLKLKLIHPDLETEVDIPLTTSGVSAGFPSPAEDYIEATLDLNKSLIKHPAATFFARVEGDSMKDDCIHDGDLLVVDKAVKPYSGCVAVCFIDGEFTLKRLIIEKDTIQLIPANKKYKTIVVNKDNEFTVWGVVTYSIKKH